MGDSSTYKYLFEVVKDLGYSVVAPARKGDQHVLQVVSSYAEVDLNYVRTTNNLRYFLQPEEPLYEWRYSNGYVEIKELLPKDRLVVPRRPPYDVNSLLVLDAILRDELADTYYSLRRSASLVYY